MQLSIDGGAERLGWALLEREGQRPVYYDSGIVSFKQDNFAGTFQEYRLALISHYVDHLTRPGSVFDSSFLPVDTVVTEMLPPIGFNVGVQAYLVNVALTTVQGIAMFANIPVSQVAAKSVHSKIAIAGAKKTKKVSKVQVRNGVIRLLPELEQHKKTWLPDQWDAIAIGLTALGFSNGS